MQIPAHLAQTIVDSRAYAAGDPVDDAFRTIRAEMPLAMAEPEGMEPFWVVSRHADIMTVEKQPGVFHNGDKSTFLTLKEMEPMVRFITGGEPNLVRSLVSLDGQEHKDLRAVVFPSVTPKALRGLEDDIRKIAKSFVAEMLVKAPECDFATDVAFLYPLRVIMTDFGRAAGG